MDSSPLLSSSSLPSLASIAAVSLVGVVDYRGQPASRSSSGRWTAALFIIGVEIAERFAYCGISSNLISYLTGPLQESTAAAAAGVNTWLGVAMISPLAGAFLADSYLGRYRTILLASLLYILILLLLYWFWTRMKLVDGFLGDAGGLSASRSPLGRPWPFAQSVISSSCICRRILVMGLGLLTLSSMLPSLRPPKCSIDDDKACRPNHFQTGFFNFALYLVALAQGGHKPCTQAFGADQFDEKDPEESLSRSSFFNWWYCGLCLSTAVTIIFLNYVQDNISWTLGFGIPFISMGLALILFLLGTKRYRFYQLEGESPFIRIGKSLVALVESRMVASHALTGSWTPTSDEGAGIDRTMFVKDETPDGIQIEEAKRALRLVPIWATCLIYAVVVAQSSTLFTKQGSTLDRRIGSNFQVPPAALQSFINISIVIFIPIYDRILVPLSRKISRMPTGMTQLQRIGIGMIISLISIAISALVEVKRLKTAKDYGLIDQPKTTIPMSLLWLAPQYIFYGIAEVFIVVGLQEFFYDQVPDALRSLGLALYLSIFGIGNFISSLLIAAINQATSKSGDSWFSDNLNRAHLDYFYWLLTGLSTAGLIIYLYFSRCYVYKQKEYFLTRNSASSSDAI